MMIGNILGLPDSLFSSAEILPYAEVDTKTDVNCCNDTFAVLLALLVQQMTLSQEKSQDVTSAQQGVAGNQQTSTLDASPVAVALPHDSAVSNTVVALVDSSETVTGLVPPQDAGIGTDSIGSPVEPWTITEETISPPLRVTDTVPGNGMSFVGPRDIGKAEIPSTELAFVQQRFSARAVESPVEQEATALSWQQPVPLTEALVFTTGGKPVEFAAPEVSIRAASRTPPSAPHIELVPSVGRESPATFPIDGIKTAETRTGSVASVRSDIRIRYFANPAKQTLMLKLEPESLGEVRVDLSHAGGEVTVKLTAATAAAREALTAHAPLLREALNQQGFAVAQVSVEPTGGTELWSGQNGAARHSLSDYGGTPSSAETVTRAPDDQPRMVSVLVVQHHGTLDLRV